MLQRGVRVGQEIELKLLADGQATLDAIHRRIVDHPQASGHRTRRLRSVYYDTSDLRLRTLGLTLRLRGDGESYVLTAKSAGSGDRLGRGEREASVESDVLDFRTIGRVLPKEAVAAVGEAALHPIFVTEVERRQAILTVGGSELEAAVDNGTVRAGEKSEPIAEVEFELKKGQAQDIFALALELGEGLGLMPCSRSKSDRGFDLALGTQRKAAKAAVPRLSREASLAEALGTMLEGGLAHLASNVDLASSQSDPEAVHQLRVALRRMRTALSMLASVTHSGDASALAEDATWLAAELGDARDLDVLIAQTIAETAEALPDVAPYDLLLSELEPLRRAAHTRAAAALAGPRASRFMLQLGLHARRKGWGGANELAEPATEFADRTLSKLHRKARKRGRGFAKLDAAGRHKVRIALKRLRYAGEPFLPMLGGSESRDAYQAALSALQDDLGKANDVAQMKELLAQIAPEAMSPGCNRAVGAVLAHQMIEAARGDEALAHAWRKFKRRRPPWKDD